MKKYVYSEEIPSRLKAIREELHLSQERIAQPMGYTGSDWNRVEKGNVKARKSFIIAICNTYNVNYDYLVWGKLPMFTSVDKLRTEINEAFSQLTDSNKKIVVKFAQFLLTSPIEK